MKAQVSSGATVTAGSLGRRRGDQVLVGPVARGRRRAAEMDVAALGNGELGADALHAADQVVLDDEGLASLFSTMYWMSPPSRRKLIGTMTRPALAVAA